MKEKFFEYYKPSEEKLKQLLNNSLLVFDTNVLLDIFRLSPENAQELLEVFTKRSEQIWIPFQVGIEFHKNIQGVFEEQIKTCTDVLKKLEDAKKEIDKAAKFFTQANKERVSSLYDKLTSEIIAERDSKFELITNNPLLNQVGEIFFGKVGDRLEKDDLDNIYKEGEQRYKEGIPPGYTDAKKKQGNAIYGDLVIWKEIIHAAQIFKTSVIFITNDQKEDWFSRSAGRTVGPRPELIREFRDQVGEDSLFYCYTRENFLDLLKKEDNVHVSDKLEDELRRIKNEDESESLNSSMDSINFKNVSHRASSMQHTDEIPNPVLGNSNG
ncbi:MAG: PIN domain-containing protein [Prevotella sp.]|nr:PIN domain-containing protein [Prevotella sp.]